MVRERCGGLSWDGNERVREAGMKRGGIYFYCCRLCICLYMIFMFRYSALIKLDMYLWICVC